VRLHHAIKRREKKIDQNLTTGFNYLCYPHLSLTLALLLLGEGTHTQGRALPHCWKAIFLSFLQ